MEVCEASVYLELAEAMERDPSNQEVWQQAISIAKEEEIQKLDNGFYRGLELDEITTMGERINEAKSLEEKYRILSERCSLGMPWYDVILGLGNKCSLAVLSGAIARKRWEKALDVGCGTGDSICRIGKHCQEIWGLDIFPFLLALARNRSDFPANANLLAGSAAKLPFSDQSFDLVFSHGLTVYLSCQDHVGFCLEVGRVLKPGGCYYEVFHVRTNGSSIPPYERALIVDGKTLLIHLIDSMITRRNGKAGTGFFPYEGAFRDRGFEMRKENVLVQVNGQVAQKEIVITFTKTG